MVLTSTKIMATAAIIRGPAPHAAAIHGFSRMSRLPLVPATATVRIIALVAKQKAKRSIPAAIITTMGAGCSILPRSTSGRSIARIAVRRATIMPATA